MSNHDEIARWGVDSFPFEVDDEEEMKALHDVLPNEYWIARDYSADSEVAIALMRWNDA